MTPSRQSDSSSRPSAPPPRRGKARLARWGRHALVSGQVVLALDIGLLFLVLPWTMLWNHLGWPAAGAPGRHWLASAYLRGAVSGLGLLNLWYGSGELLQRLGHGGHAAPRSAPR